MVDKTQQDLKNTDTVPEKPITKPPSSPTAVAVSPAATLVAATTTTTANTSPTLTEAVPAADASKPLITDGSCLHLLTLHKLILPF